MVHTNLAMVCWAFIDWSAMQAHQFRGMAKCGFVYFTVYFWNNLMLFAI